MALLEERQEAHAGRMVGRVDDRFDYDRQARGGREGLPPWLWQNRAGR
jgi:hypothetical protein